MTYLRWLIILVTSFVLSCAAGPHGEPIPQNIFTGIQAELVGMNEVTMVKGDAKNWTKYDVTFAILPLEAGVNDPVFQADLSPGESVEFKLEPGDYTLAAIYAEGGVITDFLEYNFSILDNNQPFGFYFRSGPPPVEA